MQMQTTAPRRKAKWAEPHEVGKPTTWPVSTPVLRCVNRKGAYAVVVAWEDETYSLIDAAIGEIELKRRKLAEDERLFEYLGPGVIQATHWVSFGPMQSGRW